jgi:hypothetical protein
MRSALFRLFLVVALLSGWQSALVHPIEHVDEAGEFVHLGHDHDGEAAGPLCDTLAALTACAPNGIAVLPVEPVKHEVILARHESAPRAAEAPPFLSHAPPSLS